MRIITAPEPYIPQEHDVTVFLAGGITNCPNWQSEVIKDLNVDYKYTDTFVLFNPRRENFPIDDPSAADKQIEWEYKMLERCDIFSMYFSSGDSDQPICMYELGRNILRMQMKYPTDWKNRIIITVEDDYKRKQDVLIQTKLATQDMVRVNFFKISDICIAEHVENIIRAYRFVSGKW